jgi:hypothetical protein
LATKDVVVGNRLCVTKKIQLAFDGQSTDVIRNALPEENNLITLHPKAVSRLKQNGFINHFGLQRSERQNFKS